MFSLQLLVRHVSSAYCFGLKAFAYPEFYGRKVRLLFLTATGFLLHRNIPGQWVFWSILGPVALHVLVCLFHFLYNECWLVAHVLNVFSIHAGFSYSHCLVTLKSNTSKEARLNIFCCRDKGGKMLTIHCPFPAHNPFGLAVLHDQKMSKGCCCGGVWRTIWQMHVFCLLKPLLFTWSLNSHTV